MGFPDNLFGDIKWQSPPPVDQFLTELEIIARDMLEIAVNSLSRPIQP
jgi:hypothetical protein